MHTSLCRLSRWTLLLLGALMLVGTAHAAEPTSAEYTSYADYEYQQAASFFRANDQKNGYYAYAYSYYFKYLAEPHPYPGYLSRNLNGFYQNLAVYYYLSYVQAGDSAAALAWYDCIMQYVVPIPPNYP